MKMRTRRQHLRRAAIAAMAFGLAAATPAHQEAPSVQQRIEERAGARDSAIQNFYSGRDQAPAWFELNGAPLPAAGELVAALCQVASEGLNPEDYPIDELRKALADAQRGQLDADALARADLLFTRTFLRLATHLHDGRVSLKEVRWHYEHTPLDAAALLEATLARGDVAQTLRSLPPPHPEYQLLRSALGSLREVTARGGWPTVPDGPLLKEGAEGPRVVSLRARLRAEGDLREDGPVPRPETFDVSVTEALKRFQRRHGLADDGVVGPSTLRALNAPVEGRIAQIVINMERLRLLPRDLGARHVVVNVPGFYLEARKDGSPVLRSSVVVGKEGWHTPVFSTDIVGAEVNPDWNVPRSIVRDDILPILQRAPGWAISEGMVIIERGSGARVDPRSVDWHSTDPDAYVFIQAPGPKNPLGEARFRMPSNFAIFLHGTPSQQAFEATRPALSHGCIRVEKVDALARFVFGSDGYAQKWEPAVASGEKTHIDAAQPVPVHVVYLTAWVAEDGSLQFRRDIYGRDADLKARIDAASAAEPGGACS